MLQDVTLLDWVYEWFHRPSSLNTPAKDRIHVFQAVTLLIGKSVMCHGSIGKHDLKTIHEYLTYLLLGWHPITEWPKESLYDDVDVVDRWGICKESMQSLLDFDKNHGNYYPLLTVLAASSDPSVHANGFKYGEQLAMIILALWLMKKTDLSIDADLSATRACLDLFYRSKSHMVENVDHEYAGIKGELNYELWLTTQMNRLLKLNVTTEEFVSTMSYLGWFASFIRAYRSLKSCSRSEDWVEEFCTVLYGITEHHHEVLKNASMNCNPRPTRDGPNIATASGFLRALWIKPPPVKEKFRIIRDEEQK